MLALHLVRIIIIIVIVSQSVSSLTFANWSTLAKVIMFRKMREKKEEFKKKCLIQSKMQMN